MNVGDTVTWFNTSTEQDETGTITSIEPTGDPNLGNVCGVDSPSGSWWVLESKLTKVGP